MNFRIHAGAFKRGQSLVEMSLMMPVVMLLFFGMIEVGWAGHSFVVASSSAREGARFGSRGVHVPVGEVASVVETSLAKVMGPVLYGAGANTTIIVTEIDVEEDGSFAIFKQETIGDLPVNSTVCEPGMGSCEPGDLDVQEFIDANVAFNADPELCVETFGCDGDFVVVELVYMHKSMVLGGFARDFIPDPFPIRARAVMRVLHRRPASS